MAKEPKYDDLTGFKSSLQRRTKSQVAKLISDIKRIDTVVANGNFEQLKALHVELDGIYQNRVKNWGTSMYNYIKGMGFTYDYIGDEALRDNLITMRGKLKGLLFEIDPDAELHANNSNDFLISGGHYMTAIQKKLLADYAKIKQSCAGNMLITIQNFEYPKYKDTLDYLEKYEYIRPLNIDNAGHAYMKTGAFDSFMEQLLSQEMGDETMVPEYNNKKVFVVHGHDHHLLKDVELMLRRIGLDPIIVKNEANSGRTVIEKIEDLTDVGFGIVLYTGCDEGREKGTDHFQDRARQNVIFEHGYLYAKLGRGHVAALNDAGIEIPSDLAGVLYISLSASDWQIQLMREMKAAGLEFDATKA